MKNFYNFYLQRRKIFHARRYTFKRENSRVSAHKEMVIIMEQLKTIDEALAELKARHEEPVTETFTNPKSIREKSGLGRIIFSQIILVLVMLAALISIKMGMPDLYDTIHKFLINSFTPIL